MCAVHFKSFKTMKPRSFAEETNLRSLSINLYNLSELCLFLVIVRFTHLDGWKKSHYQSGTNSASYSSHVGHQGNQLGTYFLDSLSKSQQKYRKFFHDKQKTLRTLINKTRILFVMKKAKLKPINACTCSYEIQS